MQKCLISKYVEVFNLKICFVIVCVFVFCWDPGKYQEMSSLVMYPFYISSKKTGYACKIVHNSPDTGNFLC